MDPCEGPEAVSLDRSLGSLNPFFRIIAVGASVVVPSLPEHQLPWGLLNSASLCPFSTAWVLFFLEGVPCLVFSVEKPLPTRGLTILPWVAWSCAFSYLVLLPSIKDLVPLCLF